jgi:hypothetical protein
VAQGLGVIAVGIASQDLVDLLDQEGLGRVGDELLGAGVGETLGEIGQEAELLVEVT